MTQKISSQAPWWQPGLILFIKLTRWIALPLVAAFYLGRLLDRKFTTEPWLFIVCLGASFIISALGILYESRQEVRRLEKEESLELKKK